MRAIVKHGLVGNRGEGHLDIAKLSKYFLELGDPQVVQWCDKETVNLTTCCMSQCHTDLLQPFVALQILIVRMGFLRIFADENRESTEPSCRLDRLGLKRQPGGLIVVV